MKDLLNLLNLGGSKTSKEDNELLLEDDDGSHQCHEAARSAVIFTTAVIDLNHLKRITLVS